MKNLRRKWYVENYKDTLPPKQYGIEFDLAVPQTLGDQTWYFNCKNVPDELPEGYSFLEKPIEKYIGYGLSQEEVDMLNNNFKSE